MRSFIFVLSFLLFLVSLVALPIGLIKPSIFFKKWNIKRKNILLSGLGLIVLFFILTLATVPSTQISDKAVTRTPEPTQLGVENQATLTSTPTAQGQTTKVISVVDGDTIKIDTGQVIRYIGMDTPELGSSPMCYAREASDKNKELVLGKEVRLEKDVSETDRYGRLLRYIWVGDAMVNEYLVRQGYAKVATYPPDVRYQEKFIEAERLAREEKKGLWGNACVFTPTPTPKPTVKATSTTAPQPAVGSYTCNCSKTCPQMSSCAEAQYQLNVCGCSARDADHDGIACDADCQ